MKQSHSHPVLRRQRSKERRSAPRVVVLPPAPARSPVITPGEPPPRPAEYKPSVIEVPTPVLADVLKAVTVVIVNFKTEHLVRTCLESFLERYPEVRTILIDNASQDGSTGHIQSVAEGKENVRAILNEANVGHGPAMHQGIREAKSPYVFTMDTDCETLKGGFLEEMLRLFRSDPALYGLGWLRYVDWYTGVPAPSPAGFMAYVHPSAAMYDREKYLTLYPFTHAGAPCTRNMREALSAGYTLRSFPIRDYVSHMAAGTRRMFGGRWDPGPNDEPGRWSKGGHWPI